MSGGGFFQGLLQVMSGTAQVATTKKGRSKRGKPECTPCAAQAYVEGLRPPAPKR